MEKQIITFSANEQILKKTAGKDRFADDVVGYIEAHFNLGDNWSGYDSIRAVWFTAFAQISTVLDQDGVCLVPPEVCNRKEAVNVNLVGSIVENDELTDRLTTYPIAAFIFDGNARVDGSETAPVTPSQFEQFVAIVAALVGSVKDIDHAALNADYTLTIYYSDGTSDTVGPIRGEQGPIGPTGNGIASIAKTGTSGTNPVVDTYTITYTNGQITTFTVTNGVKGDTGVGIQSIYKTGSSGAVDTYTILYTDGNTTEFTVTNGEVTNAVLAAAIEQAKEDLIDQFAVKDTASGTIASFPDGADWPAKNVLADIDPVQDLHGYDKPWSGGNGNNLLDLDKATFNSLAHGFLVSRDGDGVKIVGTATASGDLSFNLIVNYADDSLSGKGYVLQVFDVSSGYTVGGVWGFRTETERAFAISLKDITEGQNVNVSMKLSVAATSQASWTPYSNICPISGRTECVTEVRGKNLCYDEASNLFPRGDGLGIVTDNTLYTAYAKVPKNSDIVISCASSPFRSIAYGCDGEPAVGVICHTLSKTTVSATEYTLNSGNYEYIAFYYGNTEHPQDYIQIEHGSTATDYEPYSGNTYTTTLGRTVYGGTLDVVSGELVVDRAIVLLTGTESFQIGGTVGSDYRYGLPLNTTSWASVKQENGSYFSNYFAPRAIGLNSGSWGEFYISSSWLVIHDKDKTFNSLDDFKAWVASCYNGSNPIQISYKLAEPQTYQLTPTEVALLLGANNVWADTGDVEVTYVADTKLYIDKMTA